MDNITSTRLKTIKHSNNHSPNTLKYEKLTIFASSSTHPGILVITATVIPKTAQIRTEVGLPRTPHLSGSTSSIPKTAPYPGTPTIPTASTIMTKVPVHSTQALTALKKKNDTAAEELMKQVAKEKNAREAKKKKRADEKQAEEERTKKSDLWRRPRQATSQNRKRLVLNLNDAQ
jgi:hypothetical protein